MTRIRKRLTFALLMAIMTAGLWNWPSCGIRTVEAAEFIKPSARILNRNTMTVSWHKTDGADEYRIYRSEAKNPNISITLSKWTKYHLMATVSKDTTSYTDATCKYKQPYSYKVCAYQNKNGRLELMDEGSVVNCITVAKLEWDDLLFYYKLTPKRIDLSVYCPPDWGLVPEGYDLYRREAGGSYKKLATVKIASWDLETGEPKSGNPYKDRNVEGGRTYYYKARFFTHLDGRKLYGKYSDPVKLKAVYRQGRFSVKLHSPKVSDAGELIVSVKGNKYNGTLFMDQESFLLTTVDDMKHMDTDDLDWELTEDDHYFGMGELIDRSQVLKLREYSMDGKTYKKFVKSKLKIAAGKTVYLKLAKADGAVIDLTGSSLALYTSGVRYHERGRCDLQLDIDQGTGSSEFVGGY